MPPRGRGRGGGGGGRGGRGRENGRGRGGKRNGPGRLAKPGSQDDLIFHRRFLTRQEIESHWETNFQSTEEYAAAHQKATDLDFEFQAVPIENHNKSDQVFDAWVMAAPPEDSRSLEFLIRVRVPEGDDNPYRNIMPKIGEMCHIQFRDGKNKSEYVYAERTSNYIPVQKKFRDYLEFKVLSIGSHWTESLKQKVPEKPKHCKLEPRARNHVTVSIHIHLSKTTYNAETKALSHISTEKPRLLRFLVLFNEPESFTDLSQVYPHMFDVGRISCEKIRSRVLKMYDNLDGDQVQACGKLNNIPEGVFFLAGSAGSGKTRWCLSLSALAQAGDPSAKVLYLLDVNKSLDDGAAKMVRMYKDLGLDKKVIRMLKWPKEMRKGRESDPRLGKVEHDEDSLDEVTRPDFRWDFLEQWKRADAAHSAIPSGDYRAPSLDEAACQYFRARADSEEFATVRRFLECGDIEPCDWDEIHRAVFDQSRDLIEGIYRQILKEAEFIATTPVAAFCHFDGMFDPNLIFFDECAHARELSTLISILFFNPSAWFFVGNWRQTSAYVGFNNLSCAQLHLSLLERVDRTRGIECQLLTNHRSLGGLHKLPSSLFYEGKMISQQADDCVPDSLVHLRTYFLSFRGTDSLPSQMTVDSDSTNLSESILSDKSAVTTGSMHSSESASSHTSKPCIAPAIPRFVMDVGSPPEQLRQSFWNPAHHVWIMDRVHDLLDDPLFLQPDASTPGTILVISPYGESFQRYRTSIEKIFDAKKRVRVEARTLATVQGAEADVVFIDMVKDRPSHFSNDSKRLCVALTRARQAEVIMMNGNMAYGVIGGKNRDISDTPSNLLAIYRGCRNGEHGTLVSLPTPEGYERRIEDDENDSDPAEKVGNGPDSAPVGENKEGPGIFAQTEQATNSAVVEEDGIIPVPTVANHPEAMVSALIEQVESMVSALVEQVEDMVSSLAKKMENSPSRTI